MTLTKTDAPPTLQFRRAIYIYDRDARQVDWAVDGDTVVQVYPASAPPGYLQNCTRVLVPAAVQGAILRDFSSLRRLAEIAEASQPGAPIDHPTIVGLRYRVTFLLWVVLIQATAIIGDIVAQQTHLL